MRDTGANADTLAIKATKAITLIIFFDCLKRSSLDLIVIDDGLNFSHSKNFRKQNGGNGNNVNITRFHPVMTHNLSTHHSLLITDYFLLVPHQRCLLLSPFSESAVLALTLLLVRLSHGQLIRLQHISWN